MHSNPSTIENFGRNVRFQPAHRYRPKTESDVLQILARHAGQEIRVVGSRHAWSDAIKTDGVLIDLAQLNEIHVDSAKHLVSVGGGCQIKRLLDEMARHGLTIPSIGLIDEQTAAGATATGTHGSGKNSLSHYIRAVRVAHYHAQTGQPIISTIDSRPDLLAARCSLGLMGVITQIELQGREQYNIQEHSKRHKSLGSLLEAEAEYPLQQFFLMPWSWHFFGQHRKETAAGRSKSAGLYRIYWHLGIDWGLHLILFVLAKLLRIRWPIRFFYRFLLPLLIVRNWRVTDDARKMLVMEHELFRHIEMELFVTRSRLSEALIYLQDVVAVFGGQEPPGGSDRSELSLYQGTYCHHYPICIRRVLADETLISMSSPGDSDSDEDWYAISLISYQWPVDRKGFFGFADFLARQMSDRFAARAHWGKYNPFDLRQNQRLYPRLGEFRDVIRRYDAQGVFVNAWLRETIGSLPGESSGSQ